MLFLFVLFFAVQDEDVWVREVAGTAISAAAAVLLQRLQQAASDGPAGSLWGSSYIANMRPLLAVAAAPALSDEPCGLESAFLTEIVLEIISTVR